MYAAFNARATVLEFLLERGANANFSKASCKYLFIYLKGTICTLLHAEFPILHVHVAFVIHVGVGFEYFNMPKAFQ